MNIVRAFLIGTAGLVVSTNFAAAACRTTPFRFFPNQNDHVTASTETDAKGCTHRFSSRSSLAFNGGSIVASPKHGSLTKGGGTEFRYVPKAGYVGSDTYTVKVCGTSNAGSGCSTITYETTVK